MRSLILSIALGVAALGGVALTPSEAEARPWRGGYYQGYRGPVYSYGYYPRYSYSWPGYYGGYYPGYRSYYPGYTYQYRYTNPSYRYWYSPLGYSYNYTYPSYRYWYGPGYGSWY